ncbi:reverse transcriptase domain-containing protein [Tanacetum coccineum]
MKLLDTNIIYPITDSPWVSPIHCVPKKGGITVVTNENDELVPTRTVTGWRVCIDYRKLNEATAKDHFPLPFMDQMLERLAGNKYFCFLDGFSGYFQIPIDPNDQEKTTFTCPFGTYAYRRMPFGLCNAPATFQRCMLAIFHDMIEESVEVFMDDFSVFENSFETRLNNLDKCSKSCLRCSSCPLMGKMSLQCSKKFEYILVAVDYVSKWAEDQALPSNDARVVIIFLKKLFCRFEMPKALISDQVENMNRALKRILEKTVNDNPAIWSRKLDDALWDFRTAYKTPTDLIATGEKRIFQLHELDELRHQSYENSRLYKARTKVWHDRKLRMRKEFKQGDKVLLFHSNYKFKQPKLRSRWLGPYLVKHQYPSGYVELYGKDGKTFIVNGHRLKLYHEEDTDPREAVTPFFPKE